MPRNRKRLFFELPVLIIAGILLLALVVQFLWNNILPNVLQTKTISYLQALGLLILCRILFTGFHFRRPHNPNMWSHQNNWRKKWMNMNDEERAKFREEWKKRCGPPRRDNE